jgi:DNA-binding GntR family transcriptional regulator
MGPVHCPGRGLERPRYEASNTAVRAAIKELTIEGLVVGQQGRGVFVQDKPRRTSGSLPAMNSDTV